MAHSASPFNLMFSTKRGCKRKHGKVSNIRSVQRFQLHWSIGDCTAWNHQSFKDHKANKNKNFELVEETSYIPPRHGKHGVSEKNGHTLGSEPSTSSLRIPLGEPSGRPTVLRSALPHLELVTCHLLLAPIRRQFHQVLLLHIHFYSIYLHIYRLVYNVYKAIQQVDLP